MKQYYVQANTRFVPTHELSVSKKIVERESKLVILGIVRQWVNSIYPERYIVAFNGDYEKANVLDTAISCPDDYKDSVRMQVIEKESNYRFRLGSYKYEYKILHLSKSNA